MKPDVMITVQNLSRYLRTHPDACDTPEGIARWWLAADSDAAPVSLAVVEAALDWMSSCGVIEASQATDGRVRFRRAGTEPGLDARLDALVEDPRAVKPPTSAGGRRPRMH